MGIFSRLLGIKPDEVNFAKPKTNIETKSNLKELFTKRNRDKSNLDMLETIYLQGGLVSEAVDTFALFALSNGWHLEGEDENLIDYTQTQLELMDFDNVAAMGITDAIVFGDAFQEKLFNRKGDVIGVIPRSAKTFDINYNRETGLVRGYTQIISQGAGKEEKHIPLTKDQIIRISVLSKAGAIYSPSLINRAIDEIRRDTKTAEATMIAIDRHGFGKWHVKAGYKGEPGTASEVVDDASMESIASELKDLSTKNEIVTNPDIDIIPLDKTGMGNVKEYSSWAIERLCSALGVPEEILGLGRGSTEATAKVRSKMFNIKISAIQNKVARQYNTQLIDFITRKPGSVKVVFNDIDPEDEAIKAEWISKIMKATPLDPYSTLPQDYVKRQFGVPPDE